MVVLKRRRGSKLASRSPNQFIRITFEEYVEMPSGRPLNQYIFFMNLISQLFKSFQIVVVTLKGDPDTNTIHSSSVYACRTPLCLPFFNCVRSNYRNLGCLLYFSTSSWQFVQWCFVFTTPSLSSLSFLLSLSLPIYSLPSDRRTEIIVTISLPSSLDARISGNCR